jgi:hypothetical protein
LEYGQAPELTFVKPQKITGLTWNEIVSLPSALARIGMLTARCSLSRFTIRSSTIGGYIVTALLRHCAYSTRIESGAVPLSLNLALKTCKKLKKEKNSAAGTIFIRYR